MQTEAERLAQIRKGREAYYGDSYTNMSTLGMQITALIERHYRIKLPHSLPAHIADLIMVSVKLNRAANAYLADNYDDGHNYLQMSQEHQLKWISENETSSSPAAVQGSVQPSEEISSIKDTRFLASELKVQT